GLLYYGCKLPFLPSSLRWNDTLGQQEAAVEASLAGGDDAIGLLRLFVEGEALDAVHGRGLAFRSIDFPLNFGLDIGDCLGLSHDFHAADGGLYGCIQWKNGEDGADGAGCRDVVDAQKLAENSLTRNRIRREIRIHDR